MYFSFFAVNSLAYRLLWPTETDRRTASGTSFLDLKMINNTFELVDLSLLTDRVDLIQRINQESKFLFLLYFDVINFQF